MTQQFTPDQVLAIIIADGQRILVIKPESGSSDTPFFKSRKKNKLAQNLSCLAKRVYDHLLATPTTTGFHTITNKQLAAKFRCTPETISLRIRELEHHNLIQKRFKITEIGTERQIFLFDAPHSQSTQLF